MNTTIHTDKYIHTYIYKGETRERPGKFPWGRKVGCDIHKVVNSRAFRHHQQQEEDPVWGLSCFRVLVKFVVGLCFPIFIKIFCEL